MHYRMITIAFAFVIAAPFGAASAQDAASVVCSEYAAMDNAGQMAIVAEIESMNSEMATGSDISSDEIHARLTTECGSAPDALVSDVWKKIRSM